MPLIDVPIIPLPFRPTPVSAGERPPPFTRSCGLPGTPELRAIGWRPDLVAPLYFSKNYGAPKGASAQPIDVDIVTEGLRRWTAAEPDHADFTAAASIVGCEAEVLMAIAAAETGDYRKVGVPQPNAVRQRPPLLYERHTFSRLTNQQFDEARPDLSARHPYAAGTPRRLSVAWNDGAHYGLRMWSYMRLAEAYALHRDAALKSCSWGRYQIMGENFEACGCESVQVFVLYMCTSEVWQLKLLANFAKNTMASMLIAKDWPRIARCYNGPAFAVSAYDLRLAKFYAYFKRRHGPSHAAH